MTNILDISSAARAARMINQAQRQCITGRKSIGDPAIVIASGTEITGRVALASAAAMNGVVGGVRGALLAAQNIHTLQQQKFSLLLAAKDEMKQTGELRQETRTQFDQLVTAQYQAALGCRVAGQHALTGEAADRTINITVGNNELSYTTPAMDISLLYANTEAIRSALVTQSLIPSVTKAVEAADQGANAAEHTINAVNAAKDVIAGKGNQIMDVVTMQGIVPCRATISTAKTSFALLTSFDDVKNALREYITNNANNSYVVYVCNQAVRIVESVESTPSDLDAAKAAATDYITQADNAITLLKSALDQDGDGTYTSQDITQDIFGANYSTYDLVHKLVSFLEPAITAQSAGKTELRDPDFVPDLSTIALDSPIWIEGGNAGDGGSGGEFNDQCIPLSLINQIFGRTLETYGGIPALADDEDNAVHNVITISSAEDIDLAIQVEKEVSIAITARMAQLVQIAESLDSYRTQYEVSGQELTELANNLQSIDQVQVRSELKQAQLRQAVSLATTIHKIRFNRELNALVAKRTS